MLSTHSKRWYPPIHDGVDVLRTLYPEVVFQQGLPAFVQQLFQGRWLAHNIAQVSALVEAESPDAVLFWPSESLHKSLFSWAESRLGLTVAYYLAGYSPLEPSALEGYWMTEARVGWKRWPKKLAQWGLERIGIMGKARPKLQLRHVACVSQYEQQHAVTTGIPVSNTTVVHNGIDPVQFPFAGLPSSRRQPGGSLQLLYAGRLTWDKGAHVALLALDELVNNQAVRNINLTVLGKGDRQYTDYLRRITLERGLTHHVHFTNWLSRPEVPAFMSGFDVLLLPTIRAEALARVAQEAMATGLIVIGTPTGGTTEILFPEETGLVFAPEDSQSLASQILRVQADISLCDRIAHSARRLVEDKFTIDRTVRKMEHLLRSWIQGDMS